ncbi:hypothetical protein Tco_0471503 [Tanacetum coccineum]
MGQICNLYEDPHLLNKDVYYESQLKLSPAMITDIWSILASNSCGYSHLEGLYRSQIPALLIVSMGRKKFSADFQLMFRLLKLFLFVGFVVTLVILFQLLGLTVGDIFASLLAFMPTGWAILQIAQACRPVVKALGMWGSVKALGSGYEYMLGGHDLHPHQKYGCLLPVFALYDSNDGSIHLGIHEFRLVIGASKKCLLLFLVGIVETVLASSTR